MTSARPPQGEPPSLGPTLDFLRLLWVLDHALQRRSKRMARDLGLTGPQRLVVRIVGRFPDIAAGELAALLSVHPSTLTGILQRLEKGGLLQRRLHPSDRRRVLLALTERGRALDSDDPNTVEGALERVQRRLHESELAGAAKLLRELTHELEDGRSG